MSLPSLAQRLVASQLTSPVQKSDTCFSSVTTFDDYFDETPLHETRKLAADYHEIQTDAQSLCTSLGHRRQRVSECESLFSAPSMRMRRIGSPVSLPETLRSATFGLPYDQMVRATTQESTKAPDRLGGTPSARSHQSMMLRVLSLGLLRGASTPKQDGATDASMQPQPQPTAVQAGGSETSLPRRTTRTFRRWCGQCWARLSL